MAGLGRPLAVLVLLLGGRSAGADDGAARLRLASYNVQLLPIIAAAHHQGAYRAAEIGRRLALDRDLVALQESYEGTTRELLLAPLRERWGAAFGVRVHPALAGRFNGGLLIASRLPIVCDHALHFTRSSLIRDHGLGADELAAKGALHARIAAGPEHGAACIDVFVTHLDSLEASVRTSQLDELARFVRLHADPARPCLVVGDFNIAGGEADMLDPRSDHRRMLEALAPACPTAPLADLWARLRDRPENTWNPLAERGGHRLDYILASIPDACAASFRPVSIQVDPGRDARVGTLSDHAALAAELAWSALVRPR